MPDQSCLITLVGFVKVLAWRGLLHSRNVKNVTKGEHSSSPRSKGRTLPPCHTRSSYVINIVHVWLSNKDLCCAMETCKFAEMRRCRPEAYMTRWLKAGSEAVVAHMADVTVHILQLLS